MTAIEQFPPSREAGLQRLARFAPRAGHTYAIGRNFDPGPGRTGAVSQLSPYVRRRLVMESEIVGHVLARHSVADAEKFVQEVLWRTYWKGWLEMRPGVWTRFLEERDRAAGTFSDLRAVADAQAGRTGVDGFDHWARELVDTGYLHNHARMWFASIWIFTLGLPWTLGADFFLRHLIDADPASNTLSWRWVAGLQTAGKTYLASAENISRFTNGRFAPTGLAATAIPLTEPPVEAARSLPDAAACAPERPALLLVTAEDLFPESLITDRFRVRGAIVAAGPDPSVGEAARRFSDGAASDTATRLQAMVEGSVERFATLDAGRLVEAARTAGVQTIVTPFAPVGPTADRLSRIAPVLAGEGVDLVQVRRSWDTRFWPHATAGFFSFRKQIPALLAGEGGPAARPAADG